MDAGSRRPDLLGFLVMEGPQASPIQPVPADDSAGFDQKRSRPELPAALPGPTTQRRFELFVLPPNFVDRFLPPLVHLL